MLICDLYLRFKAVIHIRMVLPLSQYVRASKLLVLKNMQTIFFSSNWLRFITVRRLSPFATQLAFDCRRPIFFQKNQDSSPVATSHKRKVSF